MSSEIHPQTEFIEAHSGRFDVIVTQIDQHIDADPDHLIIEVDGETATTVAGELRIDDIFEINELYSYTQDELQEVINTVRASIESGASLRAQFLGFSYLMHRVEQDLEGDETTEVPIDETEEPPVIPIPGSTFVYERHYSYGENNEPVFSVERIVMSLDGEEVARLRHVRDEVDPSHPTLVLIEEGQSLVQVSLEREQTLDSLFIDRWLEKFDVEGRHTMELLTVLAGRFDNDEELNTRLNELWLEFIGTHLEDEVGPFLDEVRVAATAKKAGQELDVAFNMSQPTLENIDSAMKLLSTP